MTRRAVTILSVALVLGILADVLFHGAGPGLNVPLWIGSLVLAGRWVRRGAHRADVVLVGLLALLVCFAACVAWRASPFLRFWSLVALLAAGGAIATQLRQPIANAGLVDYLRGTAAAFGHLATGAGTTAQELPLPGPAWARYRRRVGAATVGVALAVPVFLVFGGLLTAADPVVEGFVTRLFDWDFARALEHAGIVLLAGWPAAGWLRAMAVPHERTERNGGTALLPRKVGAVELAVPLGTLTVLLVCFVAVQARYLFGGASIMQLTGLTYAEFARRGFFQLVWLGALVVPLLLGAQLALDRTSPGAVQSFRALVVVLVALVGLVMVSALGRMKLYVTAYGLTEDRLYATAFMTWVGGVLVWFAATELRNRPRRFTSGAVLAGVAVIAALNVLNPDGLVARTNLARAQAGLPFDAAYLARLSVDAVPAIATHWSELDPASRRTLTEGVLARATPIDDWREWNWSQWHAARDVKRVSLARERTRT
jgi:hypothetical protein